MALHHDRARHLSHDRYPPEVNIVPLLADVICSAAFYLDDDPDVIIRACLFSDRARRRPAFEETLRETSPNTTDGDFLAREFWSRV